MEAFTGLTLFSKVNGNIVLTPEGQSYLETVRSALHALSYFPKRGRGPKRRQTLKLSSPPTFAMRVLIPRLSKIRRHFPELEIDIQLSVPLVGTRAEPADVDIRFGDGHYPGSVVVKVLDEKVVAACNPLFASRIGGFKSLSNLKREHLLRCSIEPWRPWFQAAGLDWSEPSSHYSFSDVGLFADAAAHQAGIALVRPSLVAEHLKAGTLTILLPTIAAAPYYAYYATCTPEAYQSSSVNRFIEWLNHELHNSARQYRPPHRRLSTRRARKD